MWADTETETDYLNYSEIAELVAELIADQSLLPLSLGIFGGWGVGKSSTLRLVEKELEKTADQYLLVKFDSWLYQDYDNARAALMSVIASVLLKSAPQTTLEKAKSLFSRVNKLRTLGLIVEGGAALAGIPTFGVAARGISALGSAFGEGASEEDVKSIKEGLEDVKKKGNSIFREAETHDPPEEISAFRREFGEVLNSTAKTLVVFIDNLDRCLPVNAINTLEAIRLFLFMPKTAFVIAADEDMIRHAVAQHFNNPGERHVADYLDKLIQMPIRVPRAGLQEIRAYLFQLIVGASVSDVPARESLRKHIVEQLQLSWKDGSGFDVNWVLERLNRLTDEPLRLKLEMVDRMAPMLATATRVQGNPRIVKRLLNVVQMRVSIARKRKMPLDESLIAKLALFERCTDTSATEALHDLINEAVEGKPELIREIEQTISREELKEQAIAAWEKHLRFIEEWIQLEPKLAGIDLRPAVYLARETVPLRLSAASLSPKLRQAVENLMHTATISSKSAKDSIETLDGAEHVVVMEQLIGEMRKNTSWDKVRADFRGALLLAKSSPDAAKIFARFLRSLPKLQAWMSPHLRDEPWFKG